MNTLRTRRSGLHHPGGERGSMLIAAMLFAIAIALVLGSYLTLSRTSLKVAQRTFFANDAANLAEAGAEEALYCFNQMAAGVVPATAWSGWTFSSTNAMRTLTPVNRDQNGVGVIKIYVKGYDSTDAAPYVISQATVTPFDGGAPIIRTVHLALSRNSGSTAHTVIALNGIDLRNDAFVDSFDSNPTDSPTGPWQPYSSGIAQSNGSVVVLAGSVFLRNNAQIRGNLYLGPGVVAPAASQVTGTITTNYSTTFAFPTYPTTTSVSQNYDLGTTIPATLPRPGDSAAADGRYYYFCRNTTVRNFSVTAGRNVTLVGTGTGMTTGITLPATSTLHVYMDGPLTIAAGTSLNASGWAGALRIYTTTASQCSLGNNCQLSAWFHAPNAELRGTGNNANNQMVGYFVANTIYASGSMDFHYDESLQAGSVTSSYDVTRWLDFQTAADRALVAGLTNNYLQ
jgi:hypothetical protein